MEEAFSMTTFLFLLLTLPDLPELALRRRMDQGHLVRKVGSIGYTADNRVTSRSGTSHCEVGYIGVRILGKGDCKVLSLGMIMNLGPDLWTSGAAESLLEASTMGFGS